MGHRPTVMFRFLYCITKYNTHSDSVIAEDYTDRAKSVGQVEGLGGALVGGGLLRVELGVCS